MLLHRHVLSVIAAGVLVAFVAPSRPALADPGTLPASQYKLYRDYQNALEDPRVKKIRARHRLAAIARNFGVSKRTLEKAIKRGKQDADQAIAAQTAAVKAALKKTPIGSEVASVQLVDQGGVVIAYVSWKIGKKERLPFEASYVAAAVAHAAPISTMVAMWSCMGTTKVFTAKIRRSAADLIRSSQIEDFAKTRYMKLFEDVHDAFKGQPPADAAGCG